MKQIVLDHFIETISVKELKTAKNIVAKSADGYAGIVVPDDGGFCIKWSNSVKTNTERSVEELIKQNHLCKFYQL